MRHVERVWVRVKGDIEKKRRDRAWQLSRCDDLVRLLRHLAANNVLQETSIGVFKPTKLAISFTQPVFGEWINHLFVSQ